MTNRLSLDICIVSPRHFVQTPPDLAFFITLIGNVSVSRQFLDPTPRSDSDAIMVNERLRRASQPVRYGWKAESRPFPELVVAKSVNAAWGRVNAHGGPTRFAGPSLLLKQEESMKLFAIYAAGLSLLASPLLAQTTPSASATTSTTKTHTTTHKQVGKARHHTVRCGCPAHHYRMHHKIVKKTSTTTKS